MQNYAFPEYCRRESLKIQKLNYDFSKLFLPSVRISVKVRWIALRVDEIRLPMNTLQSDEKCVSYYLLSIWEV